MLKEFRQERGILKMFVLTVSGFWNNLFKKLAFVFGDCLGPLLSLWSFSI